MGVKRDATQDEIKRAYRKLARKYHPDVSKETNAEARFKELGEAYEVLKDPEKRAAYDQLGANWKSGQDFRPPPNWDQGFEFHGGGFTDTDAGQFSDFFETLFGQGGGFGRHYHQQSPGGFHAHGNDSHARVAIDLGDAYRGSTRSLTLKRTELGPDGHPRIRDRTLNIRIPKGVYSGQQIRLAGQGDPGIGQGKPGDLYLEITFNPHPLYKVENKDVYLNLPISPWEAALGATVQVPTPSGKVDLKIPPNSSSGGKLRLKRRGIPAREAGDLYVILTIVTPKANDEKSRKAYQQFAEAFSFDPRADLRTS